MNPLKTAGWDDSKPVTWRIERPSQSSVELPFLPDQPNATYEKVLFSLPVMLHSMDSSGRMNSANPLWLRNLGYAASDVVGRSFSEFLPVETRSKLITTIYPKYLVTGDCTAEEILITRKDGSLATVLLTMIALRGDKGRLQRSMCLLDDVTDRKIAEIASARNDNRFRGAFVASSQGMAIISANGQVELANDSLKKFLGRTDIDQAAIAFDELIHRDDRGHYLNGIRQLVGGEISSLQHDIRYMNRDGKVMHGATAVSLVKNDKGAVEQMIVQVGDITDRKQVNERLQKAQKMEAVGQLTGGLAHDFNNLLTIIIGNLQLLDGKLAADDKSNKRLQESIDAARKGADLTRQLLAFARKQELEPQDVGINGLVKGMESLIARTIGENIELRVNIMDGDPRALIDPSQLESAVLNLAINARDAMQSSGKLTIETQPAYLDHDYAKLNPDVAPGQYVMIAVTDTGVGMSSELLEKVFQPFFTTKPVGQGTGLGLSMVYGFIKQSGGHIAVYSELGHGTSVKMYLPRRMHSGEARPVDSAAPVAAVVSAAASAPVAVTQEASPPQPVSAAPEARKPKILVVEDQEAVRAVACGFLEDFGYDIIEAGDGFEALAKLQEHDDIDLMFSDVVMPGGMNGFDLAQAAQSMKPQLKIVHTTGYPKGAMVHQDEPRFKEGFIIMKPYRREDLQKMIKDALENQ
jgi:PAS domain S-box-containing protein